MSQELLELRNYILKGESESALQLLDELDEMSKKSILRSIKSQLRKLLIHCIKNQIEDRLTNSWTSSIRDSLIEIQDLNTKENKKSYYIRSDEWDEYVEEVFNAAVSSASVEVFEGRYNPFQLIEKVDKAKLIKIVKQLVSMTYQSTPGQLPMKINEFLISLPGGKEWGGEK